MKTYRQKLKRKLWLACSRYIRLRDSIEYCQKSRIPIWPEMGVYCSCGKVIDMEKADAGHFISRGIGGSSGVYFDERNIHLQCRSCNRFAEGNKEEYRQFMLEKYGQDVIDELKVKNKIHKYTLIELEGLLRYYQNNYEKLKAKTEYAPF